MPVYNPHLIKVRTAQQNNHQSYVSTPPPFTDEASDFHGIVSSPHIHVLENGSLNIISVQTEDKGRYLCEASNGVGPSLSTAVDLIVHREYHRSNSTNKQDRQRLLSISYQ